MLQFDHTHYVPVLRWKQAERNALRDMRSAHSGRMTPLIELVPKALTAGSSSGVVMRRNLSRAANSMVKTWGKRPFFVDLWLLNPSTRVEDGCHPVSAFAEAAREHELAAIPITGLGRGPAHRSAVASAAAASSHGVGLRVLARDIGRGTAENLQRLMDCLGKPPEEIHLLLDCQVIGQNASYAELCAQIPLQLQWRTFTVLGSAFPKDLSDLEKNRQHLIQRCEWLVWRDHEMLPRRPAFGDYTIQHARYSERSGPMNFSGSIRYTHDTYWVIMRGESVFNPDGPGFAQFPANAQLLCERREFCGAQFSRGDQYIEEMSRQYEKTGNATTWLQAGINHHMTFVVRQIASLYGS